MKRACRASSPRPSCVFVVLLLTLGSCRQDRSLLSTTALVDDLAASISLELMSSSPGVLVDPRSLRIDSLEAGLPQSLLLRVWLPIDHSTPYTFARIRGRLLTLGGFSAPNLAEFVCYARAEQLSLIARARLLARVSDTFGAVNYFFPAISSADAITRAARALWTEQAPKGWPQDTVFAAPDGSSIVRLTMLSMDSSNFVTAWYPVVYSFRFQRDGALGAWSRREGASIQ